MKAVIIGAGALGLGFLAERMAQHYELCLADVSARTDWLAHIKRQQGYTVNICSREGMTSRRLEGSFEAVVVDTPEGSSTLANRLQEADLVLTCVGRRNLDRLVARIAPSLNSRSTKAWLLFCENGRDIAESYGPHFGPQTVLVDTVMSRMCRLAGPQERMGYEPLFPGSSASLVVEDYAFIPLAAPLCNGGPFSPVFSLVSFEEFHLWEDTKFFLHNGVHAFIAFHAFLEGVEFFKAVPMPIRHRAREVALQEVVPAIVRTHSCSNPEELQRYAGDLMERFFNPWFNDTIERGVRGAREKLEPNERLLGGCEFIRRAGIEPNGYASTVKAAQRVVAARGE